MVGVSSVSASSQSRGKAVKLHFPPQESLRDRENL